MIFKPGRTYQDGDSYVFVKKIDMKEKTALCFVKERTAQGWIEININHLRESFEHFNYKRIKSRKIEKIAAMVANHYVYI